MTAQPEPEMAKASGKVRPLGKLAATSANARDMLSLNKYALTIISRLAHA